MATFDGFTDEAREKNARDVVRRAGACCGLAEAGMAAWDDYTRKIFKRWFGFASPSERDAVSNKIYRMNYYFQNLPITIEDAGATLGPNTNAMATYVDTIGSSSYSDREAFSTIAGVKIQLTDRFFNSLSRVQADSQNQMGTLVHELSHLAAGTVDAPDGSCYGRANALALALASPAEAQVNAENFGFFVIEMGGETPIFSAKAPIGSGRKWAVVQPPKAKL